MKLHKLLNRVRYGSNLNKPRYMMRLFKNLAQRYFLNARPLRGIDFAVDYACNLKCQHCFNKDILKGPRKMTLDDYARVFKEAEAEGILNFCFQGGEILIQKDWEAYLRLLDPGKFSISLTTNGTHLTEDAVVRMTALGVNTLTVSLDSGLPQEHDGFRGVAGSFEKAVRGIDFALAHGLKVVVNSTISPLNLHSEGFKRLLEYTRRKKLLLNTILAAPSGNWQGCEEIIMREKDIAEYEAIAKEYGNVVRDVDSLYLGRGCPAVNESVYITPFGDVFGCAYIHIVLGNIFEDSLGTIRRRGMDYFNYPKKCLISEDHGFIKDYNELVKGKKLPLPFEAHNKIKHWSRS
ncbi:MAG: radical SAM protein [Nitrospirae bacterium]|nr:radical SAM protein [Magnetococcales bacterium]